mmetsp:Transcript_8265/g.24522  ORF Transcript_8265/g.24522 Transcript_8265/m.24522 type:complete len:305 (+) Transcript_8265:1434-2348(+)
MGALPPRVIQTPLARALPVRRMWVFWPVLRQPRRGAKQVVDGHAGALHAPRSNLRAARDHARAVGQSLEGSSHEVSRLTPRLHASQRTSGGRHGGSRPSGRAGGRNDSFPGGEPGGRNGSCAGPGGPDDRCSVAVQLQLSPNGGRRRARPRDAAAALRRRPNGRRRPRLRAAAAASGATGRNDRRSAALRRRRNAASRRGSRRRRPDGPQVVNGAITRARTPLLSRYGPSRITQGGGIRLHPPPQHFSLTTSAPSCAAACWMRSRKSSASMASIAVEEGGALREFQGSRAASDINCSTSTCFRT